MNKMKYRIGLHVLKKVKMSLPKIKSRFLACRACRPVTQWTVFLAHLNVPLGNHSEFVSNEKTQKPTLQNYTMYALICIENYDFGELPTVKKYGLLLLDTRHKQM